jgi:lipopolysaccharide transport system permease protein
MPHAERDHDSEAASRAPGLEVPATDAWSARRVRPTDVVGCAWRHRALVWQLARREVLSRYRASSFGLFWTVLQPLVLLGLYTFVFGVVFEARWGTPLEHRGDFALMLFAGLVVYSLFAECMLRAPLLLVGNPSYVKRTVFPLEVLPWVAVGSALFHALVSLGVLLVATVVVRGGVAWTALAIPAVLVPCVLLALALGWLLASLGVYFRDLAQAVGLFTTAVLFLTPVFYPVSALPKAVQPWVRANPLTIVVEELRAVLFTGVLPDGRDLVVATVIAFAIAWASLAWFERTRPGFADVI